MLYRAFVLRVNLCLALLRDLPSILASLVLSLDRRLSPHQLEQHGRPHHGTAYGAFDVPRYRERARCFCPLCLNHHVAPTTLPASETPPTLTSGRNNTLFNTTVSSADIETFKGRCSDPRAVDFTPAACTCCQAQATNGAVDMCICYENKSIMPNETSWIATSLNATGRQTSESTSPTFDLSPWKAMAFTRIDLHRLVVPKITDTTFNYSSLATLHVVDCGLVDMDVPTNTPLASVDLRRNNMTYFPSTLFQLSSSTLTSVDLRNNSFPSAVNVVASVCQALNAPRTTSILLGVSVRCPATCTRTTTCALLDPSIPLASTVAPTAAPTAATAASSSSSASTILVVGAALVLAVAAFAVWFCRRRMLAVASTRDASGRSTSADHVAPLFTLTRAASASKLDSESSFIYLDTSRADIVLLDHTKFDLTDASAVLLEDDDDDETLDADTPPTSPPPRRLSCGAAAPPSIPPTPSTAVPSSSHHPTQHCVDGLDILARTDVVLGTHLAADSSMWMCKFQGRPAVLKRVHAADVGPTELERFIADVNLIAKLVHPHIVKLHGIAHMPDGDVCVVAEHMERGSLGLVLHRPQTSTHSLAWRDRLRLGVHIADGLTCVHSQSNYLRVEAWTTRSVLVDALLTAKLNVFDFMRAFDRAAPPVASTYGRQVMAYDAPEVLAHDCARSSTSDMYTLGVVLGELATGRMPYQSWIDAQGHVGSDALLEASRHDPQRLPHEASSAFLATPRDYQELVARCLHRDVLQRPLAVNAADVLRQLLVDDTCTAAPSPPPSISDVSS
ncbi:Aste57867_11243 [Aphanomyces stellatus]|uniref:Aste57867_11243 protein n=1 Tax=Aphanomyces stellatus TaxID=120398 RepID=A0A485KSX5_9STRA|nr:hypothetical protein As57867_011201 [Aphanomyces stellatus]VFT88109.1 Aste57867_11243 [Aphanomyces stellatus]